MFTYLDIFLERVVLFAPSVLSAVGLLLILELFRGWRVLIWQDRLFGIISDNRKGELPPHLSLLLAALQLWPLSRMPLVQLWWQGWMNRTYGAEELLEPGHAREYVRRAHRASTFHREIRYLGKLTLLVLAPLREELLYRLPLLIVFQTLTMWGFVAVFLSACYFGYSHWRGNLVFVSEETMSWAEGRDSTIKSRHRIMSVCATLVLGLWCGLAAIYYQSLWVAILIHCTWNYAVPKLYTIGIVYWLRYIKKRNVRIVWGEIWKI